MQVDDQITGTEKILSATGELDDLPYDITWSAYTFGPPQIEALNAARLISQSRVIRRRSLAD